MISQQPIAIVARMFQVAPRNCIERLRMHFVLRGLTLHLTAVVTLLVRGGRVRIGRPGAATGPSPMEKAKGYG